MHMPRESLGKTQRRFGIRVLVLLIIVALAFSGWYLYDRYSSNDEIAIEVTDN